MIKADEVIIYGKEGSGYCTLSKTLCEQTGIDYSYKSLEKEGFDVVYNKNVKTVKNEGLDVDRGKQILTIDNTDPMPVVLIKRKTKDIKIKSKKVYKKIAENNPAINMKEYLKKLQNLYQGF